MLDSLREVPMATGWLSLGVACVLASLGCGAGTINDGEAQDEEPIDVPAEGSGGADGVGGAGGANGGAKGTGGSADAGRAGTAAVDGGGGAKAEGGTGGTITVPANVSAKDVATKLGLPAQLLWGMGNDGVGGNAPVYGIAGLKLHYVYLSSFNWPTWNQPEGAYARMFADDCANHGIVPVMTLYQSAAWGDGNIWGFQQDTFMQPYWHNYDVLLTQMAAFDQPVVIQIEPDFWGYAMNLTYQSFGKDPAAFTMLVTKYEPACSDLPDNLIGFGTCVIRLAHQKVPKALVGLQPSVWAAGQQPQAIANFMKKVGAGDGDVVFVETLDRDAGCWEAAALPQCQGRSSAGMYWSDAGFATHFAYVKTMTTTLGRPAIWWQTPLGVPSTTPGGSPDHYRDNRVEYFFAHPDQLVSAGGVGVMFGVGAGNQTTWDSDGGQLKTAVANYVANPVALP
jgi:hypothetical protein